MPMREKELSSIGFVFVFGLLPAAAQPASLLLSLRPAQCMPLNQCRFKISTNNKNGETTIGLLPNAFLPKEKKERRFLNKKSLVESRSCEPLETLHFSNRRTKNRKKREYVVYLNQASSASTRHNTSSSTPSRNPSTPSPIPTGATLSQ